MELAFTGEVWHWRGPSPYHFVTVPDEGCAELEAVAPMVSYGWGMIPVAAQVGDTRWTTSLWPRDDAYVVPLKDLVRRAEDIEVGDTVAVRLTVDVSRPSADDLVAAGYLVSMSDQDLAADVPERCDFCGVEMETGTIDFDETNEPRAELNPGEMVQVAFCPNPDCPGKAED